MQMFSFRSYQCSSGDTIELICARPNPTCMNCSLVPRPSSAVPRRGVVEGDAPAVGLLDRPRVPPGALHAQPKIFLSPSSASLSLYMQQLRGGGRDARPPAGEVRVARPPARWTNGAHVVDGVPQQPDLPPRHVPYLQGKAQWRHALRIN